MFRFEDFLNTLDKVSSIFSQHGIRSHLVGGAAGIAHGEPRFTPDIDLAVDNATLTSALPAFSSRLPCLISTSAKSRPGKRQRIWGPFQLLDRVEALKLAIDPREMVPGELERTVRMSMLDSSSLPVASREDSILSKLAWISKGSHKSRRDVRVLYRNTNEAQRAFVAEVLAEPDEVH